jgi:branched-chain amino acid transport system ATP-binding protein
MMDGEDITNLSPHRIRHRGLLYLPEGRSFFPALSVADNLRMGCWRVGRSRGARDQAVSRSLELFPVLGRRMAQRAGTLSGGEQQMLSLARIFLDAPKVIVADEPSLGLAPLVIDMVFEVLDKARQDGAAIVLIEQFVQRALSVADKAVILQRGSVTWSGPADQAAPELLSRYLGEDGLMSPEHLSPD